MKKTIKIGERFRYRNITLEVREGKGCIDCYAFYFKNCETSSLPLCSAKEREDKNDIIFVKIKGDKNEL